MLYSELERLKNEIDIEADELDRLLKEFSNLIDDNVGRGEVWQGTSATAFKGAFEVFSVSFPTYVSGFKKQVSATLGTLKAYEQSEQ